MPDQPTLFDALNEPDEHRCPHCDGDRSEPDHERRCDGRQGKVDAEPEPPYITIPTTRDTSIQSFYDQVHSGEFDTRRMQIWQRLERLGVSTANEVSVSMSGEANQWVLRGTYARLAELRDLGLVREMGERHCTVTGRLCITWSVVHEAEYAGVATVNRCPTCGQTVSRDIPVTTR